MLKSREKYKIQKPQKVQSISEKLREESQSLSTNKMTGKSSFDRLFKDREVVIVKKESKHKKKAKKSVVIKEPKEKMKSPKKLLLLDEGNYSLNLAYLAYIYTIYYFFSILLTLFFIYFFFYLYR